MTLKSVPERIAKARSELDRAAKAAANCTEMALIVPQVAPGWLDRYSQPHEAGLDSGRIPRELAPCLAVSLAPAHDASAAANIDPR